MDINDYPLLKDELLKQMVAKAISSTGDFFTFKASLTDQVEMVDCYVEDMSAEEKREALCKVNTSELTVGNHSAMKDLSHAIEYWLMINLRVEIQDNFVDQMQNELDDYWAEERL